MPLKYPPYANRWLVIFLFICSTVPVDAQLDLGTHFMRGVWQSTYSNPALVPDHDVIFSMPGIYNSLEVSGFTYNELLSTNSAGETLLDLDAILPELDDENVIRDQLDIPSLALGFRLGQAFFSLGHSLRTNAYTLYPRELPEFVWNGNAQYIGQKIELGPDIAVQGYHEIFLGFAYTFPSKLTLGGRFKYLSGFGDLTTEKRRVGITTDEDTYGIFVDADFIVNSTGVVQFNGFGDVEIIFDENSFGFDQVFTNNTGMAVDFGLTWQTGNMTLTASILDLGSIRWDDEVVNYSLKGNYQYEGIDVIQQILDDSLLFEGVLDSLDAAFPIEETNEAYSTRLPVRSFVSAEWQLGKTFNLGGLLYFEDFRGTVFPAVGASAQWRLSSILSLGALYAYRNETFDNLGLNASVRLGPLQLVGATDNIITVFRPGDSRSANMRVGLNFVFGKDRSVYRQKTPRQKMHEREDRNF